MSWQFMLDVLRAAISLNTLRPPTEPSVLSRALDQYQRFGNQGSITEVDQISFYLNIIDHPDVIHIFDPPDRPLDIVKADLKPEVINWLAENCEEYNFSKSSISNLHVSLTFGRQQDAIAFKLRWL